MSCECPPCGPVQPCEIENFGQAFPSLVGPTGPAGGAFIVVENLAALRLVATPLLTNGFIAFADGHTTVNDGGGGWFEYVAASVAADNNGTIVRPVSGIGRWYRSYAGPVNVKWFGAKGDGVTNDSAAIQAAVDYLESVGGGVVYFTNGTYRFVTTLVMKTHVNLIGSGVENTKLDYTGSSYAIDALGSGGGGFPVDRKIVQLSDMEITGIHSSGDSIGIRLGHNYRSAPLLRRVRLSQFRHYGIYFYANNWNICFEDVEIDQCGRSTVNSSGIYKAPGITDMNSIRFDRCMIEGCGNATSSAGGLNITSTALYTNRGWSFVDCVIEGNFGSDEAYFTNMRNVSFINLYMERTNVAGQLTGIEFSNVTGVINSAVMAAEAGAPLYGFQFKLGSNFNVEGVNFSNWATSGIDIAGSKVHFGQNVGLTVTMDSSSEPSGVYSPRFSATSGVAQVIPTGAFTKVLFATEVYDITGGFAASAFVPRTVGTYSFKGQLTFSAGVDVTRVILALYADGVSIRSFIHQSSGVGPQSIPIVCNAIAPLTTNSFEIYVRQDSGGNLALSGDGAENFFTGELIQPAVT